MSKVMIRLWRHLRLRAARRAFDRAYRDMLRITTTGEVP